MPDTLVTAARSERLTVDDPVARFGRVWREGRPDLARFLAEVGPLPPADLAAVVRLDQRLRWLSGDSIPAESYVTAYPALDADPELALSVIHNEFLLRNELGRSPALESFLRRFPRYADLLRSRIEGIAHQATAAPATVAEAGRTTPHQGSQPAQGTGVPTLPGYEILEELGRGGMGVVYKARQMALDRIVALKMVLAGAHAGRDELERFQAEAHAVARLQHPNLVQIHEVGDFGGLPYFSLEFVGGGTLAKQLAHAPQRRETRPRWCAASPPRCNTPTSAAWSIAT